MAYPSVLIRLGPSFQTAPLAPTPMSSAPPETNTKPAAVTVLRVDLLPAAAAGAARVRPTAVSAATNAIPRRTDRAVRAPADQRTYRRVSRSAVAALMDWSHT